jgi:hypothetical protein
MTHLQDSVISMVSHMPDEVLWALYALDAGSARMGRWLHLGRAATPSTRAGTNRQPVSFLCFIGANWFTGFLVRKMRQYGFYCFTHSEADEFKGWRANYREFSATEMPVDHATQPDFILVDHIYFRQRRQVFGHEAMHSFIKRVSRSFSIPVIGVDSSDTILYKFHPRSIDCFDVVLKGQGLPKDRELMNWEIGVRWGLNRKKRIRRVRFEDQVLSSDQIAKFRVSFDLGCAAYGDVQMDAPPSVPESYDVFFIGVFDSLNRLEGLRICRQHFRTLGWLQIIRGHPVVGIESWKADPKEGRAEDRAALIRESDHLYRQHRGLFRRARLSPRLYKMLARSSRVMLAFSGIGELGMRHYQAFEFAKVMICEDVSYIETIFPFEDHRNCLFVEERLGDLQEKVRWLLANEDTRCRIASAGHSQLKQTYRDGNAIFERYFLDHLGIRPSSGESSIV